MRRFVYVFIITIALLFTGIFGCDIIGIPESLSVRSTATHYFDFGISSMDLSEYLSAKAFKNLLNNNTFQVYEYNPDGRDPFQHLMIEYPVINNNIDLSAIIDNLDFSEQLGKNVEFEKTFTVPDMKSTISSGLPLAGLSAGNVMPPNQEFTINFDGVTGIIKFGLGNQITSLKISDGGANSSYLRFVIERPSGWGSVTATPELTVTGVKGSSPQTVTGNDSGYDNHPDYLLWKTIDLNNKEIMDLDITGRVKIENTGQAGVPVNKDIKLDSILHIEKLESATVDIGNVDTSFAYNTPVPDDLKGFVKSIEYSNVGVSFNYENGLPPRNTVEVSMQSNFLNMPAKTVTLAQGGGKKPAKLEKGSGGTITVSGAQKIDANINLNLPGADTSDPDHIYITVQDINVGDTYSIGISDFKLILDWIKIVIDGSKLSPKGSVNLPIDLANIFKDMNQSVKGMSDFIDKLRVSDIPVYLYVSEIGPDLKFAQGKLTITHDQNQTDNLYSDGNGQKIPITMSSASLPLLQAGVIKTNFDYLNSVNKLSKTVFKDIFNNKYSSLKLDYDISLGNVNGDLDITKQTVDAIKANGGTLTVKAAVYIDFPLQFHVQNATSINIMDMADMPSGDLLGRSEPMSTDDIAKYLDSIEKISMLVSVGDNMFFGDINFLIKDSDNILGESSSPLQNLLVSFTPYQTLKLLQTYPYKLDKLSVDFKPNSGIQIPHNSNLAVSGRLSIKTNGTISIFGN